MKILRLRLDLILAMRDIYINSNLNPLIKLTSSRRSSEFEEIPPWNISQMITKAVPISTRIVISYAMKWGIPFWVWWKVNGNWDNKMIKISQWRESHCETNTSIRRKKEIQIRGHSKGTFVEEGRGGSLKSEQKQTRAGGS